MTKLKFIAAELAIIVIGYVAVWMLAIVGRMTLRLGRTLFSR